MRTIALCLSALALFALPGSGPARAQAFPGSQPIRIVVPFLPGAANDTLARITAGALTPRLGTSVVVENKAGAGSQIGTDFVVKSPPDGRTLLWASADGISVLPAVKPDVPYRVPEDFTFIAQASETSFMVVVSAALGVKTIPELIAHAKANQGRIRYGTSGVGSIAHVGHVLLEKGAGISMSHIPYKGMSAVVTDLIAGHIDMALITPQTISPHAESDKLRILATTGSRRAPRFPNLPTLVELGFPDVVVEVWFGVLGPPNLPPAVTTRLQNEIGDLLKDPEVIAKLKTAGFAPLFVPSEGFRKYVVDDLAKWKRIAAAEKIVITE